MGNYRFSEVEGFLIIGLWVSLVSAKSVTSLFQQTSTQCMCDLSGVEDIYLSHLVWLTGVT